MPSVIPCVRLTSRCLTDAISYTLFLVNFPIVIVIDQTYISDDIADEAFVCDLEKCKGTCCIEGDVGAPLLEKELPILEALYSQIVPYLTEAGLETIVRQGTWVRDADGDPVTPTIGNKECVYALYDEKGILKCGIEQAWRDGKIPFRKPISCHLYPIRITRYDHREAVNYHRWHVCAPACSLGKELSVPVYRFLKEALVRKYGENWYWELEKEIEKRRVK
jgi:DNA-binding transcriptional ArsR family regulator